MKSITIEVVTKGYIVTVENGQKAVYTSISDLQNDLPMLLSLEFKVKENYLKSEQEHVNYLTSQQPENT